VLTKSRAVSWLDDTIRVVVGGAVYL